VIGRATTAPSRRYQLRVAELRSAATEALAAGDAEAVRRLRFALDETFVGAAHRRLADPQIVRYRRLLAGAA